MQVSFCNKMYAYAYPKPTDQEKGCDAMDRTVGARIRQLRKMRKMTQSQVAEKLGVSRQKLARMENGSNDVTMEQLSLLASLFDVAINDITKVLQTEQEKSVVKKDGEADLDTIFELLDLFYANRHVFDIMKEA